MQASNKQNEIGKTRAPTPKLKTELGCKSRRIQGSGPRNKESSKKQKMLTPGESAPGYQGTRQEKQCKNFFKESEQTRISSTYISDQQKQKPPSGEDSDHREMEKIFAGLLNCPTSTEPVEQETHSSTEPKIDKRSLAEVKTASAKLKNNKAPGTDGISAEMITYGERFIKINKSIK